MDDRVDRVARRFEIPMLIAALLVIPAIVIENSGAGSTWNGVARDLNWVIWAAFAAGFFVVMLTGIGFVALLTAALAERFLAREVQKDVAKIELPEQEALAMLHDVSARLARLEESVDQLHGRS